MNMKEKRRFHPLSEDRGIIALILNYVVKTKSISWVFHFSPAVSVYRIGFFPNRLEFPEIRAAGSFFPAFPGMK